MGYEKWIKRHFRRFCLNLADFENLLFFVGF